MDTYTIYKHTNKVNGKSYVGQTLSKSEDRWKNGYGYMKQSKFWRAIKKYGWDNFDHTILAYTYAQITADMLECYWIKEYDCIENGYNCKEGGSHGKHSEETIKKIIKSNKGKKRSEETRRKISIAQTGKISPKKGKSTGKHHSDDHKRKISENNVGFIGRHHTEDTKKKMSIAKVGKPPPNKGIPMKQEQKDKLSKINKGKTWKLIDGKRIWMEK